MRFARRVPPSFPLQLLPGLFHVAALVCICAMLGCEEEPLQPWRNHAPRPPSIDGPTEVLAGQNAEFDVTCYDPDGHRMIVLVSWGDGDTSDYGDFVRSEQTVQFEHIWTRPDTYLVSGWCRDVYLAEPLESGWSSPVPVVVLAGQTR